MCAMQEEKGNGLCLCGKGVTWDTSWMNAWIHHVTMTEQVRSWVWRWIQIQTETRDKRQTDGQTERERQSERMKQIVWWRLNALISWVFCFEGRAQIWQAALQPHHPLPWHRAHEECRKNISPQHTPKSPHCSSASLVDWTPEIGNKKENKHPKME